MGKGKGVLHFKTKLLRRLELPMNQERESPIMQVTVTVSDAIVREAGVRGLSVIEYVESLIDRGGGRGVGSSGAYERNRAHSRAALGCIGIQAVRGVARLRRRLPQVDAAVGALIDW